LIAVPLVQCRGLSQPTDRAYFTRPSADEGGYFVCQESSSRSVFPVRGHRLFVVDVVIADEIRLLINTPASLPGSGGLVIVRRQLYLTRYGERITSERALLCWPM
jgi:hypothetical protein